MRRRILIAAAALAISAAGQATPRVTRTAVAPVERSFDERISRYSVDDPIYVLGASRGVYLEGFGLVLSTEVDLLPATNLTPFRPEYTKEEKARIRLKKLDRVGKLKELMGSMLVDAAAMLDTVPDNEQIAVSVTLLHKRWEDTAGLPGQIVMQGQRSSLVKYKSANGQTKLDTLAAIMKVQEY